MRCLEPILIVLIACGGCSSGPHWKRQGFAFSMPADPPATNASETITSLSRVSISPIFQSRSFTYRMAENSYEQDPYAGFLVPPERALAEPIRAWMRTSGAYGRVVEPGSGITPNIIVEVSVTELYGDFREAKQPKAVLALRVVFANVGGGVILQKEYSRHLTIQKNTAAAVVAGWNQALGEIMGELASDLASANQTH